MHEMVLRFEKVSDLATRISELHRALNGHAFTATPSEDGGDEKAANIRRLVERATPSQRQLMRILLAGGTVSAAEAAIQIGVGDPRRDFQPIGRSRESWAAF